MAKCAFCGTTKKKVQERDNGVLLCDVCEEQRQEKLQMTKEEEQEMENKTIRPEEFENVQEAELEEEVPATEEPKCEITMGVRQDGSLYFNAAGDDPNLLTIEGLLDWGKRRVERIWEEKEKMGQQAE